MKSKIKSVAIKNFRSHPNTYIEFGDFTIILGDTDSGKSAMLGSISWCLFNEPSGDKFIRNEFEVNEEGIAILGEDGKTIPKPQLTCDVQVNFDNGKSIRHVKGPKTHFYELILNDEVVLHLENFGVGAIGEVTDFHGMRKVDFFGEKQVLNFCAQMDKPFFLGETPQTRAVMIGKLAHTDVVDLAIKNTDSELRTTRKIVKEKKLELKETNDELKNYKNLAKMEKDIEKAEKYILNTEDCNNRYEKINSNVLKLKELKVEKAKLELLIAHESDIERTISILDSVYQAILKINTINRINNMRIDSIKQSAELKPLASMDPDKLSKANDLCDESTKLLKKWEDVSRLNNKLIVERNNLLSISKIVQQDIDMEKVIDSLNEASEKLNLTKTINQINEKLADERRRKEDGNIIINKLNVSLSNTFIDYKEKLRKSKKCFICSNELTSEKIESLNIEDIL